jgi:hypothetical protein
LAQPVKLTSRIGEVSGSDLGRSTQYLDRKTSWVSSVPTVKCQDWNRVVSRPASSPSVILLNVIWTWKTFPVKVDTCSANKGWGLVVHLTTISDSVKCDNNDAGHCSLSDVQTVWYCNDQQKLKVLFYPTHWSLFRPTIRLVKISAFLLWGRRGTRTPKHFVNLTGESKNFS